MATVPPGSTQEPGLSDSERKDLVIFIGQLQRLLSWVVYDNESSLPDYFRPPLIDAWRTAQFRFDTLAQSIASTALDAELVAHGLSGSELRFKLIAFRTYFEAWNTLLDDRKQSGGGLLSRLLRLLIRRRE